MPVGASDGFCPNVTVTETHEQCSHGYCLNHNPRWASIGKPFFRYRIRSLFWVREISWFESSFKHHCDRAMYRMTKHVIQRCTLCGREEEKLLEKLVLRCACCGYTFRPCPSWVRTMKEIFESFFPNKD